MFWYGNSQRLSNLLKKIKAQSFENRTTYDYFWRVKGSLVNLFWIFIRPVSKILFIFWSTKMKLCLVTIVQINRARVLFEIFRERLMRCFSHRFTYNAKKIPPRFYHTSGTNLFKPHYSVHLILYNYIWEKKNKSHTEESARTSRVRMYDIIAESVSIFFNRSARVYFLATSWVRRH